MKTTIKALKEKLRASGFNSIRRIIETTVSHELNEFISLIHYIQPEDLDAYSTSTRYDFSDLCKIIHESETYSEAWFVAHVRLYILTAQKIALVTQTGDLEGYENLLISLSDETDSWEDKFEEINKRLYESQKMEIPEEVSGKQFEVYNALEQLKFIVREEFDTVLYEKVMDEDLSLDALEEIFGFAVNGTKAFGVCLLRFNMMKAEDNVEKK